MDRLFQIVYILLRKKQVTAKELAELFEVSTRTIYRDVDTLSIAGIPIYTSKGKGGGIHLLEDFVIDKSVLSNEEKDSVLMGLEVLKATQYDDVDGAIRKLSGLFSKRATNWIEVDFSYWGSSAEEKMKFDDLKHALTSCTAIRFDYCDYRGKITTRVAYPIKLVFKQKSWYLIAYCTLKSALRVFKIHRIRGLALTEEVFDRQQYSLDGFELAFPDSPHTTTVKATFSKEAAHRVYDEFSRDWIEEKPDGSFDVVFPAAQDEGLYGYIISFGSHIKVEEPVGLVDIIRERLEKTLENYQ